MPRDSSDSAESLLSDLLRQSLSKDPQLAAKQRRLLDLLAGRLPLDPSSNFGVR